MWQLRAQLELLQARRTWFGTLTLTPAKHDWCRDYARHRMARNGVDYDALPEREQFAERHRLASAEVTAWLKRLRKAHGWRGLRYLLVCERHQSGLPHFHVLLHEQLSPKPLTWRMLQGAWTWGHAKFKLVADEEDLIATAHYVCKYLTKSDEARVRASIRYGQQTTLSEHSEPVACDEGTRQVA